MPRDSGPSRPLDLRSGGGGWRRSPLSSDL